MAFPQPLSDKEQLKAIASTLRNQEPQSSEYREALRVLSTWRSGHLYPMNTFQSLLRSRVRQSIAGGGEVVTRLKRAPSIIAKLHRIQSLQLHQMQDIAGLRAVVAPPADLDKLHALYMLSRFEHELVNVDNYVLNPKPDGYRSIHLKYRYKNRRASQFDGLRVEVQLRTQLQHAWATAVETADMFSPSQAIKAGGGEENTKQYFKVASACFSHIEKRPVVEELATKGKGTLFHLLAELEAQHHVLSRLEGYALAAQEIGDATRARTQDDFYVVSLNLFNRNVTIHPFSREDLANANELYTQLESAKSVGAAVDSVLVAATSISSLARMYPNYFLDTRTFVQNVRAIIAQTRGKPVRKPRRQRS